MQSLQMLIDRNSLCFRALHESHHSPDLDCVLLRIIITIGAGVVSSSNVKVLACLVQGPC